MYWNSFVLQKVANWDDFASVILPQFLELPSFSNLLRRDHARRIIPPTMVNKISYRRDSWNLNSEFFQQASNLYPMILRLLIWMPQHVAVALINTMPSTRFDWEISSKKIHIMITILSLCICCSSISVSLEVCEISLPHAREPNSLAPTILPLTYRTSEPVIGRSSVRLLLVERVCPYRWMQNASFIYSSDVKHTVLFL